MKIAASITTYNRPKECARVLLDFINEINMLGHEATFFVIDDCSDKDISALTEVFEVMVHTGHHIEFRQCDRNHGKKEHWMVVNEVFDWYRVEQWDYAFYLQDDLELQPDFIANCITLFEKINHREKCCLNFKIEESRKDVPVWTRVPPLYKSRNGVAYYQVGWTDLHFMATREFFRALDYEIEPIDPERWNDGKDHLSSGVGRQISIRLFCKRKGMFQVKTSLAKHRMIPSVMNPDNYKKNPKRLRGI